MNTQEHTPTISDVDITSDVEQEQHQTLDELVPLQKQALIRVDKLQSEIDDIEARIAEQFPELAVKRGALQQAKTDYELAERAVKERALIADEIELKAFRGAIYLQEVERVTQFDKQKAAQYIRNNFEDAQKLGLVKFHILQSDWQSALRFAGVVLPESVDLSDIIVVEKIVEARTVKDKIRDFVPVED